MASKDTYHDTQVDTVFETSDISGTQELLGDITDIYLSESTQYIVGTRNLTAGTVTITIQDGDDPLLNDAEDVNENFVFNSPLLFTEVDTFAADHSGYVGHKRYTRVKVNSNGVNVGAQIYVFIMVGKAWHNPLEGDNLPTG